MAVKVRIPTPLQKLTNNQSEVQSKATSIDEMLIDLEKQHPGIKERLCDEQGRVRRFVNIYVNGEDVRVSGGAKSIVPENAEISIIPAIAGG